MTLLLEMSAETQQGDENDLLDIHLGSTLGHTHDILYDVLEGFLYYESKAGVLENVCDWLPSDPTGCVDVEEMSEQGQTVPESDGVLHETLSFVSWMGSRSSYHHLGWVCDRKMVNVGFVLDSVATPLCCDVERIPGQYLLNEEVHPWR